MTAESYAIASDLGKQKADTPLFLSLSSAAELIDNYTDQFEGLLSTKRTFNGTVKGGRYIRMPAPVKDISTVTIAAPNSVSYDQSAVEALAIDGTYLGVDDTILSTNDPTITVERTELKYTQIDENILYLQSSQPYGTQVLVDATIGWGNRVNQRTEDGFAETIGAGEDMIFHGTKLPDIGTTYQWDLETMTIKAHGTNSSGDTIVKWERGVNGTKITDHDNAAGGLWRLDSPSGIRTVNITAAKRIIFMIDTPNAGIKWDDKGSKEILVGMTEQLDYYKRNRWQ